MFNWITWAAVSCSLTTPKRMYEVVALFSALEVVVSLKMAAISYVSDKAVCLLTGALRMWCWGLGSPAVISGFIVLTSLELCFVYTKSTEYICGITGIYLFHRRAPGGHVFHGSFSKRIADFSLSFILHSSSGMYCPRLDFRFEVNK